MNVSITSWSDISDRGMITNHDEEGDTLYGIEIMVDPEYRSMKIGRRLYEARKELAKNLNLHKNRDNQKTHHHQHKHNKPEVV